MKPVSASKWVLRGYDTHISTPELDSFVEELTDKLEVGPLTAKALSLRKLDTVDNAREFLQATLGDLPDPFLMADMDIAVQRLVKALEEGERIAVHGDYDVDGVTGCALLVEVLQQMGGEVEYHIPHRMKDGYGLSADALKESVENGCKVAISVDCGVSAVEEAKLAQDIGLDLIITDHHQPPDNMPSAIAVLDPHRKGCNFPFKELAGVGVAFFLMIGLRKALREKGYFNERQEPDLRTVTDLVALGTVADVAPLKGANRTLTRFGLNLLSKGTRPGVAALKRVAGVRDVTAGAVGFKLGPRLNAAGRVDSARMGVELLLMNADGPVDSHAEQLDRYNNERKHIEQETLEQAIRMLEDEGKGGDKTIVLAHEGWHSGVIGIVASRLVERYHRPTVLIAIDKETGIGKGSARSIKKFHVYEAFKECSDLLVGFGGHEHAAGLSIEAGKIADFVVAFDDVGKAKLSEDDMVPRINFDGEVLMGNITLRVIDNLELLAPYGMGNPEPTFMATRVKVQQIKHFGDGGKHVFFYGNQGLEGTLKCVAFGKGEMFSDGDGGIVGEYSMGDEVDILFAPDVDEFRGVKSVRCMIKDIRKVQANA